MADRFDISKYASDSESIGSIVFWTLSDKRTPSKCFSDKIDELGLSRKRFREETMKANFIESVKDACKSTASKMEKMKDDEETLMYGIYGIGCKDDDLNLDVRCRVVFFKKTNAIQYFGDQAFGECVQNRFDDFRNSISVNLVRSFVISTIRDNDASLLRPTGGIYFVPVYNVPVSDKLATLLSSTGSGTIFSMKIPNCDNEKEVTMELAKDDMVGRLNEVIRFVSSAKQEKTVNDYFADVNDIKELAVRYSQLLNGERQLKSVVDSCKDVEQMIADKIAELRIAKEKENDKA